MVLTLAKRDVPDTVLDEVGTVVCDVPPLRRPRHEPRDAQVPGEERRGAHGDRERVDGLTPLLHWTMGPEAFRTGRNGGESVRVSMAAFRGVVRDVKNRDGKPLASVMTTKLSLNRAQRLHRDACRRDATGGARDHRPLGPHRAAAHPAPDGARHGSGRGRGRPVLQRRRRPRGRSSWRAPWSSAATAWRTRASTSARPTRA